MRLSHFFIDRPVFAAVVAIIITLVGAIAFPTLPTQTPCRAGPYANTVAGVVADVSVDPCGNLMPDNPYYRWRIENMALHTGAGAMRPKYFKLDGRYYVAYHFHAASRYSG